MQIKLLFITFYELIEYILDIVSEFDNFNNVETHYIPYLHYQNTEQLKNDEIYSIIANTIREKNITHIFWFFFPEASSVMEKIKLANPGVVNVFYNFDDPKSFNTNLVNKSKYIDIFINPLIINVRKYMYIIDKKIYHVPQYVHKELLLNYNHDHDEEIVKYDEYDELLELDSLSTVSYDMMSNDNDNDNDKIKIKSDQKIVSVFLDDDYTSYDLDEKQLLNEYIRKIKVFCFNDNVDDIRLYGDLLLENEYQDIYEDTLDILTEGKIIIESSVIIILDMKAGLDKRMNNLIPHCMIHNKPIITNSNQMNLISALMNELDTLSEMIIVDLFNIEEKLQDCLDRADSEIDDGDNINIKTNTTTNVLNDKILSLNQWVSKIIDIMTDYRVD